MKAVIVKYAGMQEGFISRQGSLPPRALYNVVGGDVPELLKSTVTLESLHKNGYVVKEEK